MNNACEHINFRLESWAFLYTWYWVIRTTAHTIYLRNIYFIFTTNAYTYYKYIHNNILFTYMEESHFSIIYDQKYK